MRSREDGKPVLKALCIISRNGNEVLASLGHDHVKNEGFARIVGGTIEFGETSVEALQREVREELGTEIEELELVDIVENIFTYQGQPGHEIDFLYKGRLADASLYERNDLVILDDPKTGLVWVPIAEGLKIYPEYDYAALITN